MNLSTTPDRCHHTTLKNAELVHLIEAMFQQKWTALKTASRYVAEQL